MSEAAPATDAPSPATDALDADERALLAPRPAPTYTLVRFLMLRLLALVYLVAFLVAANQAVPLIGHHGLEPADAWLRDLTFVEGSHWQGFIAHPSVFWIDVSDGTLQAVAWVGAFLAAAALAGITHAALFAALWLLQLSFTFVGQTFWGYGWEILLAETGFLAIFLCPLGSVHPFPRTQPPLAVIWLNRWLIFRVMLGAGLIKLRGDPCWVHLTCLQYHYETQPNPSPLSWGLHQLPPWFHSIGVLFNHVVELVAPWAAMVPIIPHARRIAGALIIAFQIVLILSGNLSFLNWLTIVPALACLDDALLLRLVPRRWRPRLVAVVERTAPTPRVPSYVSYALAALVVIFSINPAINMLSSRQVMNTSYDRLHLVNTYGAFGTIERVRHEVVLEGTRDAALGPSTRWREYEFPCKPGDPARRPCLITPYHYRLDWQMWFAGLSDYETEPWIVHLAWKLLRGERGIRTLLARDPFPRQPPRYVRATLYRYRFTHQGERGWWVRQPEAEYLRPLSLGDPELRDFLTNHGW